MPNKTIARVTHKDYDRTIVLTFEDGTTHSLHHFELRGPYPRVGDLFHIPEPVQLIPEPVGDADDIATEAAIKATGQQGRRVRMEQIDALMATVKVHVQRIDGTCSTVAAAALPVGDRSFTLAIGHSACVDPAMFNAEIGAKVATEDALAQARKKLWELEGYALMNVLAAEQILGHAPGTIADEL